MSLRILVAGASGFLGVNMVRSISRAGEHPLAGMREGANPGRIGAVLPTAEIVICDLTMSFNQLVATLKAAGPKVIVNCAVYGVDYHHNNFDMATDVNIRGARRLVLAAAASGCERFVQIGTSLEYGDCPGLIDEETPLNPAGIYGVTKAGGTLAVLEAARCVGLPAAVVRAFSMYGPFENPKRFVPTVIAAGLSGRGVDLTAGRQFRDYLYVEDVAQGVTELCRRPDFPAGEIFNFASGLAVDLRTLGAAALATVDGQQSLLRWGGLLYRPNEIMRSVGDPSKAHARLGWRATTSLEEGLKRTAAYLRG